MQEKACNGVRHPVYWGRNHERQPINPNMAPNQPDQNKRMINARIDRELYMKMQKLSAAGGRTMSDIINELVTMATSNITLTREEYAELDRKPKKSASKRQDAGGAGSKTEKSRTRK